MNEIHKTIKIAFRYRFNTLFSVCFWMVLMVLLSYTIAKNHPEMVRMFVSSFMIWLVVNNSFIAVVDSIVSETSQGTLEQLYLNSRSFYGMLLIKGISATLWSVAQTLLSLLLGIILIPQINFSFWISWLGILPLLLLAVCALIGAGIASASLSLKYKNISSFYSLVSSIFFGVVTYGAKSMDGSVIASLLIPFGKTNSALQMFFETSSSIPLQTYAYAAVNSTLYMLIGYICLHHYERKAKNSGLFSKF